jgi:hypothetical protein
MEAVARPNCHEDEAGMIKVNKDDSARSKRTGRRTA